MTQPNEMPNKQGVQYDSNESLASSEDDDDDDTNIIKVYVTLFALCLTFV